ncbi:MAG TPA: SAM-dependent methyltransferase [Rectinemataceae bacterium]|nr:SAM-dependent methyltransferase [Rectinemataceae bacterium]
MQFMKGAAYLAARGFLGHLLEELPGYAKVDEELVGCWGPDVSPRSETALKNIYWTRNVWKEPFLLEFDSISQAAKALRAVQRNWAAYPTRLHRRTALIVDALPHLPTRPKSFPFSLPESPMGSFTLLDEHLLLGSAVCSSPFPNGEFSFVEDKEGPPSRAYRKLWEALLFAGRLPGPGDICVDAGACPGGWTWALAGLGADVLAIDRAPLDDSVAAMPGVRYMKHDAFTLKPADIGPVDWLCSDVICYPEALFDWISAWRESGLAKSFICTIKMQGASFDKTTTDRFAAIPGSKVIHLWHNRHELTWINAADPSV